MLSSLTVRDYAAKLAAGEPTPGGGSAAALAGALAAALAQMAGNFTAGREKFAAVDDEVRDILAHLESQRVRLLDLTDADADAYATVGAAYGLPRGTDEEKAARKAAIEAALKSAAAVPLAVTEACAEVIAVLDRLREISNPNLLSDVACAAAMAAAALRTAWLNVEVNLASLGDAAFVAATRAVTDARLAEGEAEAKVVFERVAAGIRGE
jgi:formiminotetrahydrofolate cyclodeaminase